jgi:uncharacterized iron-regulated protein
VHLCACTRMLVWSGLALGLPLFALACTTRSSAHPPTPVLPSGAVHWQSQLDVDHPLVGVIWDVAAERRVSEAELVERVQAANIVLLGETHDNPDHHRMQATLLRYFAARHDAPAIVFEMLEHRQQPAVDATLRANANDVDALAQTVGWASSGWPAWSMYRPIFEAAVAAHGLILAAGIDRDEAMRTAHEGVAALAPTLVGAFGLDSPLPPEQQASLRRGMSEAHCGLLADGMLDTMVLVQRARDALLAERLHEGARGHGALLIAGTGHVRRDRGVPEQLARAYGTTSLAVALLPVSAQEAVPQRYAAVFDARILPFDFVWFTPRASDVDHCAELRQRMSTRSDGGE